MVQLITVILQSLVPILVLFRVSITVSRYHNHSKKTFKCGLQFREVQLTIIMVGDGSMQADMVLEK